jgi:acetyl-CoA carboxylase carboxyl transferase subunit alpha
MHSYLDFEKPIAEIEGRIRELRQLTDQDDTVLLDEEVGRLETKAVQLLRESYMNLTPWQKTQVARHPARPHFVDYAEILFDDMVLLSGDRLYGEDAAILGGPARFRGRSVMVIGHEKGATTQTRLKHNFGMARPEGYRKAVRLMRLAERFKLPVLTLVDTAGAYPGVGAEERGQAEAIARATECCLSLGVPIVSIIIGEGGSGGAVALAAANRVLMLEHAIYSVISPEGCASILWRDAEKAKDAASAMRITAQDLKELGAIDSVISEPVGGAHRAVAETVKAAGDALEISLKELAGLDARQLRADRRAKFLAIGRLGLT